MKKWVCSVCGYVYEGENPPAECPVCHVCADKFIEQKEEKSWAAEHVVGVGKSFGNDVPEEVRKEIIDGGGSITKNPGTYDSYKSTINNANSRLVPDKLAVFLQYTTNFQDNYYQFKSCTYDQESLTNIPLSVMPGKYKIQCHLVSYKFNNANQTDILDIYQVHGENDMTLIGRAEGIVANAFDNGLATGNDVIGLLSAEYEVTGTYQPLELRIVIPGKFTAGEKRRICVGRIVLTPTDNY